MKSQRAMAYVNMFGVLGTLEVLCDIDAEAKKVLSELKKPTSLCFDVKGGPCATMQFSRDGCRILDGTVKPKMKMNFSSPEKFNKLIDESKPGIPVKNPIGTLLFLLGTFSKLTDLLSAYLRPTEEDMRNTDFFNKSTILTLYTISGAISALANNDEISKISASYTPDGEISLGIKDCAYATIIVENGVFSTERHRCHAPRALMEFATIELAAGLFAGKVSSINEVCRGTIRIAGMISMIDNVNRILDRVAVYLA